MELLKFNFNKLIEELNCLPLSHRIAFSASCCERMLPNYKAFTNISGWGDYALLRNSLNIIWKIVKVSDFNKKELKNLIKKVDKVIPDTEEFSFIEASHALDAGNGILETLVCCEDADSEHCANVASFCVDTVDMHIQERDDMDYSDTDFEDAISRDKLMQNELIKQLTDIQMLKNQTVLDDEFINSFRLSVEGKSNINIIL